MHRDLVAKGSSLEMLEEVVCSVSDFHPFRRTSSSFMIGWALRAMSLIMIFLRSECTVSGCGENSVGRGLLRGVDNTSFDLSLVLVGLAE